MVETRKYKTLPIPPQKYISDLIFLNARPNVFKILSERKLFIKVLIVL